MAPSFKISTGCCAGGCQEGILRFCLVMRVIHSAALSNSSVRHCVIAHVYSLEGRHGRASMTTLPAMLCCTASLNSVDD